MVRLHGGPVLPVAILKAGWEFVFPSGDRKQNNFQVDRGAALIHKGVKGVKLYPMVRGVFTGECYKDGTGAGRGRCRDYASPLPGPG